MDNLCLLRDEMSHCSLSKPSSNQNLCTHRIESGRSQGELYEKLMRIVSYIIFLHPALSYIAGTVCEVWLTTFWRSWYTLLIQMGQQFATLYIYCWTLYQRLLFLPAAVGWTEGIVEWASPSGHKVWSGQHWTPASSGKPRTRTVSDQVFSTGSNGTQRGRGIPLTFYLFNLFQFTFLCFILIITNRAVDNYRPRDNKVLSFYIISSHL